MSAFSGVPGEPLGVENEVDILSVRGGGFAVDVAERLRVDIATWGKVWVVRDLELGEGFGAPFFGDV
jgi:hypothetical protein